MPRLGDISRFYEILSEVEDKVGGKRVLSTCDGRMDWPKRGVYFFFENGELRSSGDELRVVRVGTHAVSANSKTTLWSRLRTHRGNLSGKHAGGGNHRASILRLLVGSAIINKENLRSKTWGRGSSAKRHVRDVEHPVEIKVSNHIRTMPLLWLKVDDPPGAQSMRKYIEKNSIALLSNYGKMDTSAIIDPPSKDWLGLSCRNQFVRESGLWNVNHVKEGYNTRFLDKLKNLVDLGGKYYGC